MSTAQGVLALALLLAPGTTRATTPGSVEVRTESLRIELVEQSAQLIAWEACTPSCDAALNEVAFGTKPDPPRVRISVSGDPDLERRVASLAYRLDRRDEAGEAVLEFVSQPLAEGLALHQTWRIPPRGYQVTLEIGWQGVGAEEFAGAHPLELELSAGRSFVPPIEWGVVGPSEVVSLVRIDADSVERLAVQLAPVTLDPSGWTGVRNRFWTLLVRSDSPTTAVGASDRSLVLRFQTATARRLRLYSGPIERGLLRAADPALEGLLFSHLWFWMRWLSLALLYLLDALRAIVPSEGVAILLLAVCVKLLMRPLTATAERWQRGVNEIRTRLQPAIDELKAISSGAERSSRLLDLHREHGVSPFYGLKSLLGVLIQIPIFIAAYHMLDENFALSRVGFLWIADLVEPDRLVTLHFAIPFFGESLNLLPFVMSGVTLLSSRLHDDGTLSPDLLRKQRYGLYVMAFSFFALFYSFPAGMVLYWTSNNLVALAKDASSRFLSRRRDGTRRLGMTRTGGLSVTPQQVASFQRRGFAVAPGLFDARDVERISRWLDELERAPETPGRHWMYFEPSRTEPEQRLLNRIENFAPFHAPLAELLSSDRLVRAVSALLREPAILFKDKVNFKLPGGGGFEAHQDAQAGWNKYADLFVTAAVAVDRATLENGCFELGHWKHRRELIGELWAPLSDEELTGVEFVPYPMEPGDVAFFDSYLPHRSAPNGTRERRRVLYVTYNRASAGDQRARYYADKHASYPPDCEREPGKDYAYRV